MNPALANGPGGPGMDFSGTWLNKKNNSTVTVRGNFFDGDRMFVMTTAGEQIDGVDFTNNYIQVGGTEKEIQETLNEITKKSSIDPMFEGLEELKKENDKKYGVKYGVKKPVKQEAKTEEFVKDEYTKPVLNSAIKPLFKKTDINYNINIDFSNWPKEPIKMAMEYYDVSVEDIVKYVISSIKINEEKLQEDIKNFLES